jgi:hypothetical protein
MRSKQVQELEDFEEHKRREIQALKDWDRERKKHGGRLDQNRA